MEGRKVEGTKGEERSVGFGFADANYCGSRIGVRDDNFAFGMAGFAVIV